MLSFECIKNEKSVYFLLTSAQCHRIDLSAQPSLRKRYKTHKIPEIRSGLGF